ncbi:hypothetical protein [Clostridium sp.]|uniref:hypothetical protein n=1 Tax=Clostridium sp. TaxID=1506 RepID=UPI002A91EA28|nr:hypothetical protein [Clostridium sp.]MDY6013154.1 hypothetical protein [Clostridium sp.]
MTFKIQENVKEGTGVVKVVGVELLNYNYGKQALKTMVEYVDSKLYATFLVFTNNHYLINKLIDIAYEIAPDDEIDEQKFVGIYMEITTKEKNGYMNIVDINPVEVEEEEEESEFEESDDIEL